MGKKVVPVLDTTMPHKKLKGHSKVAQLARAERRHRVMLRRARGHTLAAIAADEGVSTKTVSRDVKRFIEEFRETKLAEEIDAQDVAVINNLIDFWFPKAQDDEMGLKVTKLLVDLINARRSSFGLLPKFGRGVNVNVGVQVNTKELEKMSDEELREIVDAEIVEVD